MKARHLFALAAMTLTVGACDDDDDDVTGPGGALEFTATLSGANEVPVVSQAGSGTATFTLNEAETSMNWSVTVSGMTSNITNAHIRLGRAGVAGGVVVGAHGVSHRDQRDLVRHPHEHGKRGSQPGIHVGIADRADAHRRRLRERAHVEQPGRRGPRADHAHVVRRDWSA